MRRGVVLLLYVAILVGEMSWSAVTPLLPSFADRFSLGDGRTGLILSVASLAILVVSIPAGAITRTIGARRHVALLASSGAPAASRPPREDEPGLGEMMRVAGGDDMIRASVALMLVASLLWLTVYLLVPLRLDAEGWSSGDIGLAFSVSSVIYAVVSWGVARWATPGVAAAATGSLAGCLAVVVVDASVAATIAFLMLAGIATAVMIALTFPLGVAGPRHVSVALVGGLLNVAWALSGLAGPTLGGIVAEAVGDRSTFLLLGMVSAGAAWWMWRARRRIPGVVHSAVSHPSP